MYHKKMVALVLAGASACIPITGFAASKTAKTPAPVMARTEMATVYYGGDKAQPKWKKTQTIIKQYDTKDRLLSEKIATKAALGTDYQKSTYTYKGNKVIVRQYFLENKKWKTADSEKWILNKAGKPVKKVQYNAEGKKETVSKLSYDKSGRIAKDGDITYTYKKLKNGNTKQTAKNHSIFAKGTTITVLDKYGDPVSVKYSGKIGKWTYTMKNTYHGKQLLQVISKQKNSDGITWSKTDYTNRRAYN